MSITSSKLCVLSLLFLLLSCTSSLPERQECTLIGCEDGLNLRLEPMPERFTLSLTASDGEHRTLSCPSENLQEAICFPEQVFIPRFTPSSLKLQLRFGNDQLKEAELTPEYSTQYPNGQSCEPACRQGTLTLQL